MSVRGTYSKILSNEGYVETTQWKTVIPFESTVYELFFTSDDTGGTVTEDDKFDPRGHFHLQINGDNGVKLLMNPKEDGMKSIRLDNMAINSLTIYGKDVSYYYYGIAR